MRISFGAVPPRPPLREAGLGIPFIVISGTNGEEVAVAAPAAPFVALLLAPGAGRRGAGAGGG